MATMSVILGAVLIQQTAIQVVRTTPDLTTCMKKRSVFGVFICFCWWVYDIVVLYGEM